MAEEEEKAGTKNARLTDKKAKFVAELIKTGNKTQAAIKAGYSIKTAGQAGSRLSKDPAVKAELEQYKEKFKQELAIDANYVVNTIKETIERCRQGVIERDPITQNPILFEGPDGELYVKCKFDAANVLKGTEQLAKILSMYESEDPAKKEDLTVIINNK